jgi:predicted DNA-binding protein
MRTVSIELPIPLHERLRIMAEKRATTKEALVIEALQSYIAKLEEETPITAYDLAKDIIGIVDDDGPADLSYNKKYMEGYGLPRGGK